MECGHGVEEKTSHRICFRHPLGLYSKDPGETPKAGAQSQRKEAKAFPRDGDNSHHSLSSYTSPAAPQVLLRLASLIDKEQHFQGEGPNPRPSANKCPHIEVHPSFPTPQV